MEEKEMRLFKLLDKKTKVNKKRKISPKNKIPKKETEKLKSELLTLLK